MIGRILQFAMFWCVAVSAGLALSGCRHATPQPEPVSGKTEIAFRTHAERFEARGAGGVWRPLFLKGVNLGAGIPGSGPNCRTVTEEHYALWFNQMSELGANGLRVYNLQPPAFYRALAAHNLANAANPLYLIQGVWLDDTAPPHDLHALTAAFDDAIEAAVRRIHGAGTPATPDVSRWTFALLIGREVMPEEVRATDENRGAVSSRPPAFTGRHFRLESGTPTECWLAARLEHAVAFERAAFGTERPVGFSSWPPLDPLRHPTESRDSGEDIASVDLANLEVMDAPAGFFVGYHVYPYNPDFMNEDPGYRAVRDADGPNPYLGYLRELKAHYRGIPLLVAEFGVPSSWGCARFNPAGMGHGGHDEEAQGRINARLLRSIHDSGCAGGVYFAWLDEWWKGNWITRRLNFPQERRRLWHNLCDPEANYGLIAFDPPPPAFTRWPDVSGAGAVRGIRSDADSTVFHLRLTLDRPLATGEKIVVGLDTYGDGRGEQILPDGTRTRLRCEFALVMDAGNREDAAPVSPGLTAQLYVTPAYDLCGIFHGAAGAEQRFHSTPTSGAGWHPVRWQNAAAHESPDGNYKFPAACFDIGRLRTAALPAENPKAETSAASSLAAVLFHGNTIEIRLPYALLQFTDPSALRVMDDDRATPEAETAVSGGIAVAVACRGSLLETGRFRWEPWTTAPPTAERRKPGYFMLRDAFRKLDAPAPQP